MNKLLFNDNLHSGQTLITILLVMAVSLTVGLAISSRTISTLRQTSYTAQANAAYFAAEAGIEDALQKLKAETITLPYETSTPVKLANDAEYHYKVESYGGTDFVAIVEQDKVAQVDLSSTGLNGQKIKIYWKKPAGEDTPAIEYIILKKPASGNAEMIEKGITDPELGTRTGISDPSVLPGDSEFDYSLETKTNLSINSGDKVILRIKPLFATNVPIKVVCASGGCSIPQQQVIIRSKGSLGESVRQINVIKSASPALPSIFDFALYSGSSADRLSIQ